MGSPREELTEAARQYAQARGISLEEDRILGAGIDGTVWGTSSKHALKVCERESAYVRERDVYLRLREQGVTKIHDFEVPELVNFDDALLAIEMTVVNAPYILDFAKCYLDRPPDFSPEVLAETRAECEELFGDDWPVVRKALARLQSYGIWYVDASPRNIQVRPDA